MALVGLRGGMSIYSGWLTAATILGASNLLKNIGMSEENGWDEELGTVIMSWIAFGVFAAATSINQDPVYGAVLVWAATGIRAENVLESDLVSMSLDAIRVLMLGINAKVYMELE